MGSNQSQQRRHYQRPYTYNRDATTTYSDMSTVARQKRGLARVLLERKCRFLGRFYAKELSEANLSRLRNHIRLTKGQKTKLRLTSEGIGSGSKFGTIFKNKLPAEFTPLADIIDIFTDNRFGNILCIAMKFPDGNYEIQAYRMFDEGTARQFQYAYSCLPSGYHPAHTPVPYDHNTSQWSNNDNWVLKDEGNLTSEPVTRRNGLRKTTSLHNAFETTDTRGHNRSFSPSWATREDHVSSLGFTSAKGNIGKKLTDVSARDMDYQTYTGGPGDDSLSQGSGDSNEELSWRLHNLSREVNNIRSTMDDRHTSTTRRHNTSMMNGYGPRDDGKSKHYVLTPHRDLDDRWSDDGSDVTDQMDGLLVDSRAGTVKARAGDHRPGGYHVNTNQSNSHTGYHVGTASTKIGQGRRMNGHISRLPNGEIIKQENGRALKVNNNPNHLMYVDDMKEAKRYHTVDPHRSPHGKARSTDGYRSTAANRATHHRATHHRAPSETSFHGGNTLAKARVSRPVDKIYLPTGGGHNDYYVINPRATGRDMQKYAHSDIGATRYDHKNRRQ